MKPLHFLYLFLLYVLAGAAGLAGTFEEHPFFKAVTGNWIGEGELVSKEGKTIQVREVWKGKVNPDGTFSISGKREWGEDIQEFTWSFSHNPSTDLYECEYSHSGMENPLRLEVSVTDKRAVLTAPFGESGGELVITNALVGETMEGEVLLKDGNGVESLKGKVIHARGKKE